MPSSKIITIYGPYYPQSELDRINNLKKFVRKGGFIKINLVKFYPSSHFPFTLPSNPDSRNLERSRYCLRTSDLNIIIFTFKGENTGVALELDYALREKCDFLFFREVKGKGEKKKFQDQP